MNVQGGCVASIRQHIRIAADPDTVWDIIKVPESQPDWFPGIIKATYDPETRIRVITVSMGVDMPEEILTVDPSIRRFAYKITAPLYSFHYGIIDVIEIAPNDTLCIYSTTAEPEVLALLIGAGTMGALEKIKEIAEQKVKK